MIRQMEPSSTLEPPSLYRRHSGSGRLLAAFLWFVLVAGMSVGAFFGAPVAGRSLGWLPGPVSYVWSWKNGSKPAEGRRTLQLTITNERGTPLVILPAGDERLSHPSSAPFGTNLCLVEVVSESADGEPTATPPVVAKELGRPLQLDASTELAFVFDWPSLEPDTLPDEGGPPERLRVRLTVMQFDREPETIEGSVDLADGLQEEWKKRAADLGEYRGRVATGESLLADQQFSRAVQEFQAAEQSARRLSSKDTNPLLEAVTAKLSEARTGRTEEEQVKQCSAALTEADGKLKDLERLLEEAATALSRGDSSLCGEKLSQAASEPNVSIPEVPAAGRLPQRVADLTNEVQRLRARRGDAQNKLTELKRGMFNWHEAAARTARERREWKTALHEARQALSWHPGDAEATKLASFCREALRTGLLVERELGEGVQVRHLALSDETRCTAVLEDGRVLFVNWSEGLQEPQQTRGTLKPISALSADGQVLVTAWEETGSDGRISPIYQCRRVASGEPLSSPAALGQTPTAVAILPSSRGFGFAYLAAGRPQITRHSWDATSSVTTRPIYRPQNDERRDLPGVRALAFTPDEKMLLAATNLMIGWFDASGAAKTDDAIDSIPSGHGSAVEEIAVSGDGAYATTRHAGGELAVWRIVHEPKFELQAHADLTNVAGCGPVRCCCFDRSGSLFATGHDDGQVLVHHLEGANVRQVRKYRMSGGAVTALAFADPVLIAGTSSGELRVWDRRREVDVAQLPPVHEGGAPAGDDAAARPAAGPPARSSPGLIWSEDFKSVEQGRLPAGWTGDDALSVAKSGDRAWLQASSKGWFRARTTPIAFPDKFELVLWFELDYSSSAVFALKGAADSPDLSLYCRRFVSAWEVALGKPAEISNTPKVAISPRYQPLCMRLVRDETTFLVIAQERVLEQRRLSEHPGFEAIEVYLSGPRQARLLGATVTSFSDSEPARTFVSLAEDFKQVQAGSLPSGWSGPGTAVQRQGALSWLGAVNEDLHICATPELFLPDHFSLEAVLSLTSGSELDIILGGRRKSSDMTATFSGSRERLTVGITGVESVTIGKLARFPSGYGTGDPDVQPLPIRLERKGDLFSIYIDRSQSPIVTRRVMSASDYDFGRVLFRVEGGSTPSRVHSVSLKPLAAGE